MSTYKQPTHRVGNSHTGRYRYPFIMEYKVILCLLLSVIAAYAEDKEEKVDAAVGLKNN